MPGSSVRLGFARSSRSGIGSGRASVGEGADLLVAQARRRGVQAQPDHGERAPHPRALLEDLHLQAALVGLADAPDLAALRAEDSGGDAATHALAPHGEAVLGRRLAL